MNIAITGASGYIGGALSAYLKAMGHNVLRLGRGEDMDAWLDLTQAYDFDYDLLENVDYVAFAAAISGPDECADEFEKSYAVNVIGAEFFIKEALNRDCRVLFFSSDAVYPSRPGEIYDENSAREPKTPYGKMKAMVEERFQGHEWFKSARLSYVVSAKDKFTSYLINCAKKNYTVEIFHPFYRNVIMLDEVLISVLWLIEHWTEYQPATLCLAGEELIGRVEMADEFNKVMGNKNDYHIIMPKEDFFKNRPKVTEMRSRYLYEKGILQRLPYRERLRKQMEGTAK